MSLASIRSCPALNACSPAPVITTARILSSLLILVSASASSPLSARLSAFKTRGRLSVMKTTFSVCSHTMLPYMQATLAWVTLTGNRQRVQDVDRVDHVQPLPQPTRCGGVRMQDEPLGIVQRPEKFHRLLRNLRRLPGVRPRPPVRAAGPGVPRRPA